MKIIKLTFLLPLQKFYKEKYNREKGKSSFSHMKTLPEVEHATEVHKHQSDVSGSSRSFLPAPPSGRGAPPPSGSSVVGFVSVRR